MREDIALALDGSAILLVALGLWLAFHRRSWAGVLFGVLGLAVMSGSAALRAYPIPTRAALEETADALRVRVADARAEIAAITAKLRTADAAARALEQDVAKLTKEVQETEARLARETTAKLQLATKVETLRGELREARDEIEKARSQMDKIRSDALSRLKGMMSAGLSTKFYQIAILPERELVAGKSGTYFSVRLTDHAAGAQFIFPKGRYTTASSETILAAADRLASDILRALDGHADYQVFVRGGADAEPHSGEVSPEFAVVAYRPVGDGGKYAAELAEQSLRAPITNNDLPVLRAAYFRSVIAKRLTARPIDILHSVPSKRIADEDRTVELILYVNW